MEHRAVSKAKRRKDKRGYNAKTRTRKLKAKRLKKVLRLDGGRNGRQMKGERVQITKRKGNGEEGG